jgi:hypothetical protein
MPNKKAVDDIEAQEKSKDQAEKATLQKGNGDAPNKNVEAAPAKQAEQAKTLEANMVADAAKQGDKDGKQVQPDPPPPANPSTNPPAAGPVVADVKEMPDGTPNRNPEGDPRNVQQGA